jgi:hypothetical protein
MRRAVWIAGLALGVAGCPVVAAGILADAGSSSDVVTPKLESGADGTTPDTGIDAPIHHDSAPRDGGTDTGPDGPATCPSPPDCKNLACKAEGFMCVAQPGVPWTIAAAATGATPACPTGYNAGGPLVIAGDASPAVCGCTCAVGQPASCISRDVPVRFGGTCGAQAVIAGSDGGCTAGDQLSVYGSLSLDPSDPLEPIGGTCTTKPTKSVVDASTTAVSLCTPVLPLANTGCTAGEVCTATAGSRELCVVADGSVACPGSYPTARTVGGGLNDTRTCSGCECGSPGGSCVNPTLSYFAAAGCSGTPAVSIALNTQCQASPADAGSLASYVFRADAMITCGSPSVAPIPTGAVSVTTPATLCCQ